jgi:hypothetical protein
MNANVTGPAAPFDQNVTSVHVFLTKHDSRYKAGPMTFPRSLSALIAIALSATAAQACGSKNNLSGFTPSGDDASAPGDGSSTSSSSGSSGGYGDASLFSDSGPLGNGDDFPTPIIDNGAPATAPTLFGVPDQGTNGPCMYEPEMGSLFPNNWLPLRFRFNATQNETLFEIKLTIPNEKHPLVIYTTQSGYTLPQAVWSTMATVAGGAGPIHVTVRSGIASGGMLTGGPWKGTEGDIEIAPVAATGSIVYWSANDAANTTPEGTMLKGFHVGDPSVQPVLTHAQEAAPRALDAGGNGSQCIACHTSTPDGLFVALTTDTDANNGTGNASIDLRSVDGQASLAPFVTPSANALLGRLNQHAPAFSRSHWSTGDHTMLSMYNQGGSDAGFTGPTDIIWTDLEATSQAQGKGWGVIARNGDKQYAASAQFSHDGKTIVYTSASWVDSGMNTNDGLLYTVPYANRMGGTATPLPGASDPTYIQYYPTFSADDKFIAFNRMPMTATNPGNTMSYSNPAAEVFIIPSTGGTATRLVANDPPACLNMTSPGITNSWGKWSPEVKTVNGKSYYFLVFSSGRDPGEADLMMGTGYPQLYVAPIVVDAAGQVTSYAALYFRNQVETEHNHTAAWDVFMLPTPQ